MIKAFKNFWKDYGKVAKASKKWLKKHWLGYIVLCVVTFVLSFAGGFAYVNSRNQQCNYEKTV